MSQPLKSINLLSPGFKGVNTEDSPTKMLISQKSQIMLLLIGKDD